MFFDNDKKRIQKLEDRLNKIEAALAAITSKDVKTREVTPIPPILMTSERSKKIMDSIKREIIAGT